MLFWISSKGSTWWSVLVWRSTNTLNLKAIQSSRTTNNLFNSINQLVSFGLIFWWSKHWLMFTSYAGGFQSVKLKESNAHRKISLICTNSIPLWIKQPHEIWQFIIIKYQINFQRYIATSNEWILMRAMCRLQMLQTPISKVSCFFVFFFFGRRCKHEYYIVFWALKTLSTTETDLQTHWTKLSTLTYNIDIKVVGDGTGVWDDGSTSNKNVNFWTHFHVKWEIKHF